LKYQLRDKEPSDLAKAQEKSIKIDRNMQSCGKSNLLGFTKGNPLSSHPNKGKSTENPEPAHNPLKELIELMKAMEANDVAQLNAMQNRLIAMERNQNQSQNLNHHQNQRYPPNNKKWQKRGPPQDQRPPNQLETANMVHDEIPPYCRACEDFHEETSCQVFCQINEQGLPETSNYVRHYRNQDSINVIGTIYPVSQDSWKQAKDHSQKTDNITKMYGENPSHEQILELARHKGMTYQKKGNVGQSRQGQYILRSVSYPKPHPNVDLNVDLGGWTANAKILVPVS